MDSYTSWFSQIFWFYQKENLWTWWLGDSVENADNQTTWMLTHETFSQFGFQAMSPLWKPASKGNPNLKLETDFSFGKCFTRSAISTVTSVKWQKISNLTTMPTWISYKVEGKAFKNRRTDSSNHWPILSLLQESWVFPLADLKTGFLKSWLHKIFPALQLSF